MAEMTSATLLTLLSTPVDFHQRNGEPTAYHHPETGFGVCLASEVPADAEPVATRNEVEGMIGGRLEYLNTLTPSRRSKIVALTLDIINASLEDL